MNKTSRVPKDYTGQEFTITREFNAPRELVFKAWTDSKHLVQWWGPKGFTNPVCQWKAQAGKSIHVVMRAPNGTDYPMGGEFREVLPPERLVFTAGAWNDKGKMLFEFLHTVTFVERRDKTMLTVQSRVLSTTPGASQYIGGFEAGMTQSLERLAALLETKNEPLVMERTFDAPVARVWKAITNKEEIKQWSFDIAEFKAAVGFEFHFEAKKDDVTYVHLCKVMEVVLQKRLAYTWRYEGFPGDSLVTFELFAEGKKTRVKLTHTGLETFQGTDFARGNFAQGWTMIIGTNLKQYVEKGK
jgi:uncharacterized protein YndB with AHSA1/START domain